MGKKTWMFSVAVLACFVLGGREWLIHQEIQSQQDILRTSVKEQFLAAQDFARLRDLTVAPYVYDRYLEPIFISAQKLVFPFTRAPLMNQWRHEIHALMDDQAYQRSLEIKKESDQAITSIQSSEEPSIQRLVNVLEARSRLLADQSIRQTVNDEVAAMRKATQEHDLRVLREVRTEGLQTVKTFKTKLKKMNSGAVARYLTSGMYNKEVQQPVLDLIFKLRQEETRKRTWSEFQKTLLDILAEKKISVASAKPKKEKDLQALFDSVADAVRREESLVTAEKVIPRPTNPAEIDYRD